MKVIIIAAGKGSRLKDLTKDSPKCMLEIGGMTVLERQLGVFRENGIKNISVIKGYKAEKITYPEIRYYLNDDYENNNILHSLMYAEEQMDNAFIASYSDIIFESSVVNKLLLNEDDISIVVDTDWKDSYIGRSEHPLEEAEKVIFDENLHVKEIGKMIPNDLPALSGEFIGMLKCSDKGARVFKEYFKRANDEYADKPFMRAKDFKQAYITDFILYLVKNNISVSCVGIKKGWLEIDVVEDLAESRIKTLLTGSL